ncbi:growth-blocking peptide 3 [Cochliomyia hominivorax]
MLKTFLLLTLCIGLFVMGEGSGLPTLFQRKTTTEQPEQQQITTTNTPTESGNLDRVPAGYYKVNNLPKVEEKGCKILYECKRKLKAAENPKPCIKFCAKGIECDNENGKRKVAVAPGHCVELNEEMVAHEYNDCKKDETSRVNFMQVAMIDFPCQPGYLPDSRGRCREVW